MQNSLSEGKLSSVIHYISMCINNIKESLAHSIIMSKCDYLGMQIFSICFQQSEVSRGMYVIKITSSTVYGNQLHMKVIALINNIWSINVVEFHWHFRVSVRSINIK